MPNQPLSRDEARARARLISAIAYEVSLRLDGQGDTFESTAVVDFACAQPGATTFIDLEASTMVRAELNGSAIGAEHFNGSRIELAGLAAQNRLVVSARCSYEHTGVGLHRFNDPVDGAVYLHSHLEPFDAHRIFACFDQPDLKASIALQVDAPEEWEVLANGEEVGRDGRRRRFATTVPISTYLFATVCGPFHAVRDRHRDIDLGVFCRRSLAEHLDADEILEITKQGFDFFEALFDTPYAFGKYDQVWVPEFNAGAMENAGCITFSEHYIFRSKVTDAARESRAGTILHEMAHMWFGDLVTMRWWDDLWLNESFATYMATLSQVQATRFVNAWVTFCNEEKVWALVQDQLPSTHPIVADMVDTDAVRVNFDGITYAKGASVLRQLVAWVGDDAFTRGLRAYFRDHRFGNAELRDFLGALEEASDRELESWSREWLETAGVATLRPVFDTAGGRYTRFAIAQEAAPEHPSLRRHRLAIGLYGGDDGRLRRRARVELDVVGALTEVPELAGEPVADLLLVNDDDLTFAKIRLDPGSLRTALTGLSSVDSPLARILCWTAAWDMTRDAELATRRWVELVTAHAASEPDVGVLQRLLGQAERATDLYGDPGNRSTARLLLHRRARHELEAAEPGGDLQLVWTRLAATSASTAEGLGFIRALLDGSVVVPGLAVDTELRWHLVDALAAEGAADEALIAAELERDPTDIGRRRAATARAARPLPDAKREAWTRLFEERDMPLATMRALVAGIQRPRQEQVLMPYVDRYVEALDGIWRDRSPDEALTLTSGLYPSYIVDQSVVAAADRALAGDLPAPARRILSESRDQTLRALHARNADALLAETAR
ncbi:MAG: aminopeptidase N [Chloroflexi bacterium]|nr:MAG: aminopeptidase N [Chloroflexota bacterium]